MAAAFTVEKRARGINAPLFQHFLSKVKFVLDILVQSCTEFGVLWNPVNKQFLKYTLTSLTRTFVQCAGLVFRTKFLHSPRVVNKLLFLNYYPYYPVLITWTCQICCSASSVSVTLKRINCCCTLIIELHTNRLCCFNPCLKVALVKSLLYQVLVWKKSLNKVSPHYLSIIALFCVCLLLIMCMWNNVTYQSSTELHQLCGKQWDHYYVLQLRFGACRRKQLLFPVDLWCIPMQWQFLPNGTLRNKYEDKTCWAL